MSNTDEKIADLERQLKEARGCSHLDAPYRKLLEEQDDLKKENERLKHSHNYLTQLSKDLLMEIEVLKAEYRGSAE